MGEIKESSKERKKEGLSQNITKEILINRSLTEADIEKFNEMSPMTITLNNTNGQEPNVLAKLKKNVTIRVLGGFNELNFSEYSNDKYYRQTTYSPTEVANLIETLQGIESRVNPAWSDLEKATFGYLSLMTNIKPKDRNEEIKKDTNPDNRPLKQILDGKADSLGYAFAYKELMERLGVACRYMQTPNSRAWNEVLINGEYYPADLFSDASLNSETISKGQFELRNFLSDREFYYKKEHQTGKEVDEKIRALDHSEIQKAIDRVLNPELDKPKEIPKIPLKSKELQKALETAEIGSKEDFAKNEEVKIELTNQDVEELKEDLIEIGKYYPRALDNITLANNTGTHINMQEVVDAVYESRKTENGTISEPTQIVIESNLAEDFNIDFSNAPEVAIDKERKFEDISYSQKISFVNTSSAPIKLPDLSGKIPDSIDTIRIQDCDVDGFNIKTNTVIGNTTGVLRNARKLELVGGNTHGIANIVGLGDVVSLSVNGLRDSEFNDIMNISIRDASTMPRLFELSINNQSLNGRQILSEIKNPNIVDLEIFNSRLDNITGIDTLKNQLISFSVQYNNLSIDDMKIVSELGNENPIFRLSTFGNSGLSSAINSLSGDIISDETYNYLDSYFRRSGFVNYRGMQYKNYPNIIEKKKNMLYDFSRLDLAQVPYFIEDAKVFRDIMPYRTNPMMVKDLQTFENYLNDPSNYFEQDYLKDGNLMLTKEQLEYLISTGKRIPQNINIKINTTADLTKQELEALKRACDNNGLNLSGVKIFDDRCIDSTNPTLHNFDEKDNQIDSYEIDEYYKIRDALDEITKDIHSGMTDLEKFAVIYKRLADKINIYDDSIASDSLSKEHAIYKAQRRNKSRNLSEGLIEQEGFDISTNSPDPTLANRAVCAGYADILKNALTMVGVDAIIDSGHAERNIVTNERSGGHAWNKVKIDGNWYYADLTWDAGSNTGYRWALKGADSFVNSNMIASIDGNKYEVSHLTRVDSGERNENVEKNDFDRAILNDMFYRVQNGELPSKYRINIPEDPDFTFNPTLDIENIKQEYKNRKDDMLAKFYGDKEYQRKYDEIATRYRANEIEVSNGTTTYRTVQDYAEREDDEKFLILGEYKNSLERMTKYEAGDTSIYSGTPDQINAQYEKDKEYVETRNYSFDQHKNTQKDLATLGKYGEKLPYVPKQNGILKNGLRILLNANILIKNAAGPAYRFVGRHVAQPLHRAITRGKDASPYRNNPYHRFVARRDYFKDIAKQNDIANGKNHPIRNYITSNANAVLKYKSGNESVLKAGAYDIQDNLKKQETQRMVVDFYNTKKSEIESQITALENEINSHQDAENISEAQTRLNSKRAILSQIEQSIITAHTTGKITDIQTDAISQTQHDIASKEVNTYRALVIKGVSKLGIRRFVGPKLTDWLMKHVEQRVPKEEVYQTTIFVEKEVKAPSRTVPIMEEQPYYDIEVDNLIEKAKNKTVNMYRSVSGGNKGQIGYTIKGDEICSGFHFQDGTDWGTGFSSNAPLMTDKVWPSSFLDASNNLREDLTFSEIAKAISNGELSKDVLDNMTLQIGNKGWVYANELFEGVTKKVEAGTKVIEGATHTELVPKVVNRTRTVYEIVKNQRAINAINTLGKGANIIDKVDTVYNVAEIARPTNSAEKNNKKAPREYDYDDSEFYR